MTNTTTYKWTYPQEWLAEKAREWTKEQLYSTLMQIAKEMDADSVQDLFQREMEIDGYFEPEGGSDITIDVETRDLGHGSEVMTLTGHFADDDDPSGAGKRLFVSNDRKQHWLFDDEWTEVE